jgi:tRNA/tmRNA/rRNA uracil-C5-methylase (TrmA/RlmC/RlmD family)
VQDLDVLELDVGPVAHGGHCVARVGDEPGGRVVFVRHALPGERVRARVTDDPGGRFLRADAIEVLVASPDRVVAPCPHSGPGRCGGCDWQHADSEAQRRLKGEVVREQFTRLAGIDVEVVVDALPGGLLGWRTRIGYAIDDDGRPGLHRHRSHEVEPVTCCPLGSAGIGDSPALAKCWPGRRRLVLAGDDDGQVSIMAEPIRADPISADTISAPTPRSAARSRLELVDGPSRLHHHVDGLDFDASPTTFWQVHPEAARVIADAVLTAIEPQPGEAVVDLYAGAGLLTAVLAKAVGPTGRVVGMESDRQAVADAAANLSAMPWAEVVQARVDERSLRRHFTASKQSRQPTLIVLDPPRTGAGRAVVSCLLDQRPRAIAYVSCDPATLARDVRFVLDRGWILRDLRAFDAFPMTHHVECVALLTPN